MNLNWLYENTELISSFAVILSAIAAIKSANASKRAYKVAKQADDRETRFRFAAKLDMKWGYYNEKYSTLTICNNGNGTARNIVITSNETICNEQFVEFGRQYEIDYLSPKNEIVLYTINDNLNKHYSAQWEDDYKKNNCEEKTVEFLKD